MLEQAIAIATKAHQGQIDKAGKIYILHPIRVMLRGQTEDEMIVGILHDVIEDTDVTIEDLAGMGYSKNILDALTCITKKHKEPYEVFINRVLTNPLATQVKLYDMEDNMNRERIPNPTPRDYARYEKYEKYHKVLMKQVASYQNNKSTHETRKDD